MKRIGSPSASAGGSNHTTRRAIASVVPLSGIGFIVSAPGRPRAAQKPGQSSAAGRGQPRGLLWQDNASWHQQGGSNPKIPCAATHQPRLRKCRRDGERGNGCINRARKKPGRNAQREHQNSYTQPDQDFGFHDLKGIGRARHSSAELDSTTSTLSTPFPPACLESVECAYSNAWVARRRNMSVLGKHLP